MVQGVSPDSPAVAARALLLLPLAPRSRYRPARNQLGAGPVRRSARRMGIIALERVHPSLLLREGNGSD